MSFCSSIGCSSGSGAMASVPYCYRPMRHDKLTSLDERELNCRRGEWRPIDTGADTAQSTSTSAPTATHMNGRIRPRFIYLYLHVFPLRALPASWFSSFLGIRKKKNKQAFSHEATDKARHHTASLFLHSICNSSMQQHPALVCYFCSKLKTLWYFL